MDDLKILEKLKENCNNEDLAKFTEKLFLMELKGIVQWTKEYNKLIDHYSEKDDYYAH